LFVVFFKNKSNNDKMEGRIQASEGRKNKREEKKNEKNTPPTCQRHTIL